MVLCVCVFSSVQQMLLVNKSDSNAAIYVAAATSAGQGDASNPTLLTSAINDGSAIPSTTAAAVLACTTLVLGVTVTVLILLLM